MLMLLYRGIAPPSVFFRTFGAFLRTATFVKTFLIPSRSDGLFSSL